MKRLINKIKEIYIGWRNYLMGDIKNLPLLEQKKVICKACPLKTKNLTCSPYKSAEAVVDFIYNEKPRYKGTKYYGCSCPLEVKWANPNSKCPLGKFENLNKNVDA